jgi:GNAT superfamily N-acetyltransferase
MTDKPTFTIRPATPADAALILQFVRELAEYERLSHEVVATEPEYSRHLFSERPYAEVLFACEEGVEVGFALFFPTFSTFLGRPGLHLEDLFVRPEFRGRGYGKALMVAVARLTLERGYGRFEWSVLDWNEPSIRFYHSLGAKPMDEWTTQRVSGSELDNLAALPLPGESGE